MAAAVFHQVGSLLVLLNSLRLLGFQRWNQSLAGRFERRLGTICGRLIAPLAPLADAGRFVWRVRWQVARVALMLALLAYLSQVVVFVQPDEVAVVQRFGRFRAVLEPGPPAGPPAPAYWTRPN